MLQSSASYDIQPYINIHIYIYIYNIYIYICSKHIIYHIVTKYKHIKYKIKNILYILLLYIYIYIINITFSYEYPYKLYFFIYSNTESSTDTPNFSLPSPEYGSWAATTVDDISGKGIHNGLLSVFEVEWYEVEVATKDMPGRAIGKTSANRSTLH